MGEKWAERCQLLVAKDVSLGVWGGALSTGLRGWVFGI